MINFPKNSNEVFDKIATDVKTEVQESNPFLKNSWIRAVIKGLSFGVFLLYRTLQKSIDAIFWDTAVGIYLERASKIFGITRNPSTKSTGYIVITGLVGTAIPLNTQFSSTNGLLYSTQTSDTITANSTGIQTLSFLAGTVKAETSVDHQLATGMSIEISGAIETEYNGNFVITVIDSKSFTYSVSGSPSTPATGSPVVNADSVFMLVESIDFGKEQNIDSGDQVTVLSSIVGMDDTSYVSYTAISGGTDIETDDSLRDRFLFRVRNPISLFNKTHIELQIRELTFVSRIWIQGVDDLVQNFTVALLERFNIFAKCRIINHGFEDGFDVIITGAVENEYNGISKIVKIDNDNFGYVISGSPSTPATGTISALSSITTAGQVRVFFMTETGTPTLAEIGLVKDKILEIKPVEVADSDVIVDAPSLVNLNINVGGLFPDTAELRNSIESDLQDYFDNQINVSQFVDRNIIIGIIQNSISANGDRVQSFNLVSPASNVSINAHEKANLNSVVFS